MSSYREILTKAIVGKVKKKTTQNYKVKCDQNPDTVLGCWVINHKFNGVNNLDKINLNGTFDVNIWYSFDGDTKTTVTTQTLTYNDIMPVNLKEGYKLNNNSEIVVECLKQPTVVDVSINNGLVDLKIDKELGVEVIGSTTVKVQVEDDFDDYEEVYDDEKENELNINVDELSDNFITDTVNQ